MLSSIHYSNVDEVVKVVTPVETGVQGIRNYSKKLDSGWSLPRTPIRGRNDRIKYFQTFYDSINVPLFHFSFSPLNFDI